jgi:N-acetylmuramoyl-L-alanine amidase
MRKILLPLFGALFCAGLAVVLILWPNLPDTLVSGVSQVPKQMNTAATFFVQSITADQLRLAYGAAIPSPTSVPASTPLPAGKIKILIMPGHEPQSGGTGFRGYFERDIAVDIAQDLAVYLEKNPHFQIIVARDQKGWNPTLASYFNQHASDILAYKDAQTALMNKYLATGQIQSPSMQIEHHDANSQTALELYGINKWSSENGVAITLHLHLNDYPGRPRGGEGTYNGFAVYVPDYQFSNASVSKAVGEAIASRLAAYHATSTLPQESAGVIEDQQLIAIGSNNSASNAAALIEYGYIYEKQFQNAATRSLAEQDYAYATYLGLQDFFRDAVPTQYGSAALPHLWGSTPPQKTTTPDMYALQSALHHAGLYPPAGRSFGDCPISGYFGDCTKAALDRVGIQAGSLPDLSATLAGAVIFSFGLPK